jgi:hypothetical protein
LYKIKGKFEIKRAKLGKFDGLNLTALRINFGKRVKFKQSGESNFISNFTRRTNTESSCAPVFGGG